MSGLPDPVIPDAAEIPVADLPDDTLLYLLGSRYVETDKLSQIAWDLFGHAPRAGRGCRRSAISSTATSRSAMSSARATRTAYEAYAERIGVCRDFAHLAIAFCRCMNIPARYCNGYLGDIGVPPDPAPMDFSAWFDVFLGGKWLHLRCAPQHAAYWPHPDRPRTRRRRYSACQLVWPARPQIVPRVYRRGEFRGDGMIASACSTPVQRWAARFRYFRSRGPVSCTCSADVAIGSRLCKNSAEFSHAAGFGLFSRSEVDRK